MQHNERCEGCKVAIQELLERAFDRKVKRECCLAWPAFLHRKPARLNDFRNMPHFDLLCKIFDSLKAHRGYDGFDGSKTALKFDYYVPSARFVLEFDESQHFTAPRAIALRSYPSTLEVGFSVSDWINRCCKLDRHDNDPKYRDEQRAWRDTLRDFAPSVMALHPLIRRP